MPGHVRAGMAVQQHHRLSLAAVPHAERHVADIHAVQAEAIEHGRTYPGDPDRTAARHLRVRVRLAVHAYVPTSYCRHNVLS